MIIDMSYADRIRIRIRKDGICKTVVYLIYVIIYSFRECIYEVYFDCCFSGKLLRGNCKSAYKHLGANDVYHTKYSVMPLIFGFVPINRRDILVDVGCGKGRVINYLLSRRLKNKIIGLELDPKVAECTRQHLSRWRNVIILTGDAIVNLPLEGTIFYFYNPFSEEKVREFELALSQRFHNKPVKIIYYNPRSLHVFQNDNWTINYINFEKDLGIKCWGRINKYHDLAIITRPVSKS